MQHLLAQRLFMVRPAAFGYNDATAETNSFQQRTASLNFTKALGEFDAAVATIEAAGIDVLLAHDQPVPAKPDAIFPNNWFSTHPEGMLVLYPMYAENRQIEADEAHLSLLKQQGYSQITDYRNKRNAGIFLEGTGSLVFDHLHRIAIAVPSARTTKSLAQQLTKQLGYALFMAESLDEQGLAIYHTNVVMSIAPSLAICCFKSIKDPDQSHMLATLLQRSGRTVLPINMAQMSSFCANVLMVNNQKAEPCLLVSQTAWKAFEPFQRAQIASIAEPVIVDIATIERSGGGGIRCMVAELW
ncbi:MAG: arginine deiminase-related protein [Bacteroidia bacterium]